jgi:hypothetical protein
MDGKPLPSYKINQAEKRTHTMEQFLIQKLAFDNVQTFKNPGM